MGAALVRVAPSTVELLGASTVLVTNPLDVGANVDDVTTPLPAATNWALDMANEASEAAQSARKTSAEAARPAALQLSPMQCAMVFR